MFSILSAVMMTVLEADQTCSNEVDCAPLTANKMLDEENGIIFLKKQQQQRIQL